MTRHNLQNARLVPGSQLSRAEFEQIITAVTHRSFKTIIEVWRFKDEVFVYAAGEPDSGPLTAFTLRKWDDGLWHIVDAGPASMMP